MGFTLLLCIREVRGFKPRPGDLVLSEDFRGFTQYLHANAGILLHITQLPLPSMSFPIHYSPITLSFDAI
jgi:hypothetical protein